MEHLSNALKALFAEQDGDEILFMAGLMAKENKSVPKPTYLDSSYNESQLMHLLRKLNMYNTIDQQSIVGQILISEWMKPNQECTELRFFKDSVFNLLLHFGLKTIELKDDEPICKYCQLLRWHTITTLLGEDIFTTAYLASADIVNGDVREFFDWAAFVEHNNKELNAVLNRPMADLHMHLKGSSFNFDLSWLSVMNHIHEQKEIFDAACINHSVEDWDPGLYDKIYRAAVIRLYLASRTKLIKTEISKAELFSCIHRYSDDELVELKKKGLLQDSIPTYSSLIEKVYDGVDCWIDGQVGSRIDYIPIKEYSGANVTKILASERDLMYHSFKLILEENDPTFATLFYAYLVYKTAFRQAIVQLNSIVGFQNFANYERNKDDFIAKDYKRYLYKAAIESFLNGHKYRYLETRITPKETPEQIAEKVNEIKEAVDPQFRRQFNVILHFIKERDGREEKDFRHKILREKIKRQAFAIYNFRNDPKNWERDPLAGFVVGIDAANSEIYCRPEVFAQAFRFLKHHRFTNSLKNRPNDLNITYHVGEDFFDIADGLRAIEEAMIFLGLDNGDRLGHCLALGTDVRKYYEKRYHTICATKQVLVDNAAWLHHKCKRILGFTPLCYFLERVFHKYFREIYCKNATVNGKFNYDEITKPSQDIDTLNNIQDYYLSWLLRGNSPTFGTDLSSQYSSSIEKEWVHYAENHHEGTKLARNNGNALDLFDLYHTDAVVVEGSDAVTFEIPEEYRDDFYTLLEAVQEQLLSKIEKKRIAIECNPSSNYKIGEMTRYDEHPILKFFNYGLSTPYKRHDIAVSINTDDQGVFATSLEREYSLIALAMERFHPKGCKNSPRQIIEWLDKIRQMSVEQQFSGEI